MLHKYDIVVLITIATRISLVASQLTKERILLLGKSRTSLFLVIST